MDENSENEDDQLKGRTGKNKCNDELLHESVSASDPSSKQIPKAKSISILEFLNTDKGLQNLNKDYEDDLEMFKDEDFESKQR